MIGSSNKSNSFLTKLFIILMVLLLSFTFLIFPSYAAGNHNDGTSDGDGNSDKVDGDTIGGGGSHTAANTGEAVKGDEGFRLYLIDEDGQIVSKVVDFYYGDAPHIPFDENNTWGVYEWSKFAVGTSASINSIRSQKERPSKFYNASDYPCFDGMPHITFNPSGGLSGGSELEAWSHQTDERGVENINHVVAQIFSSDNYTGGSSAPGSLGRDWHEYKRFMAGEYQLVMEGLWWYVPGANVMRDGTWQSQLVDLTHPVSIC